MQQCKHSTLFQHSTTLPFGPCAGPRSVPIQCEYTTTGRVGFACIQTQMFVDK